MFASAHPVAVCIFDIDGQTLFSELPDQTAAAVIILHQHSLLV